MQFIFVTGALVSFLGNKHFLFGIPAEEGDTFAESRNHTLAGHRDIRGFRIPGTPTVHYTVVVP